MTTVSLCSLCSGVILVGMQWQGHDDKVDRMISDYQYLTALCVSGALSGESQGPESGYRKKVLADEQFIKYGKPGVS